jgi:predicted AlkP superfamily phosphohydrolase/phosphomutase
MRPISAFWRGRAQCAAGYGVPAVTPPCTTLVTGTLPREHGIVGTVFRELPDLLWRLVEL